MTKDGTRSIDESTSSTIVLLFAAPIMGAAAGGMGWGIRGQYGHEWGAMVPGVLVALTLVFLFCKHATSLSAARAIALTAVAFSFGGTMTYGQTIGLTHDATLVGNHEAYRWGMIGLFIKGGLWVGFGGAFLGIGLGGKKYNWAEMLKLYAALLALVFVGIQLFNRPYVPGTDRVLSWFYFPASSSSLRYSGPGALLPIPTSRDSANGPAGAFPATPALESVASPVASASWALMTRPT